MNKLVALSFASMLAVLGTPGCAADGEAADEDENVGETQDELRATVIADAAAKANAKLRLDSDIKVGVDVGGLVEVKLDTSLNLNAQVDLKANVKATSCILVDKRDGSIIATGFVDARGKVVLKVRADARAKLGLQVGVLGIIDLGANVNVDIKAQLQVKLSTGATLAASTRLHT